MRTVNEGRVMPRTVKFAAVQMDATSAPVVERLERAAKLVAAAAGDGGAQMVALPELFNIGYLYSDRNYALAEPADGQTMTWMKSQAAQHNVHLAGSLLLLDGDHVYNSMFIVAPGGRTWRYDKNHPWAWERAYFREGRSITVADTDLGKFGMLICWDYAHPELWARYAGRIDAMIIVSCPPKMAEFEVRWPDGTHFKLDGVPVYTGDDMPFGADMDAQSTWLQVPLVNTTGAGHLRTGLPMPHLSVAGIVASNPALWERVLQAGDAVVECDYYPQTKIVDAQGHVLARVEEGGDRYVVAEVELADTPAQLLGRQPRSAFTPLAYLSSDWLAPALMTRLYRRGYRRQFGHRMSPVDQATKVWAMLSALAFGLGWLIGITMRWDRRRK